MTCEIGVANLASYFEHWRLLGWYISSKSNLSYDYLSSTEEELNDYEKLKSIVLREFQLTPHECLNSFKNAVKSSGETYIQFAARLTANFQYYCSLRKVNSFESLCDLIISDKLFETLNKERATHIGIREAEDCPCLFRISDSPLVSMERKKEYVPLRTAYSQDSRYGMQPKARQSSRAGAAIQTKTLGH
ncbi:uncharacterized protein TNCV_4458581 [Trichonephila clavipes]|nr:uncharacterized protein TNCV_4458581 [Trichonephila clavipes]